MVLANAKMVCESLHHIKEKKGSMGSGSTIKLAEKFRFREVLGSFGTKIENFMKMKVDETIS